MKRHPEALLAALCAVMLGACATGPEPDPSVVAVTVMTFNVENLFDNEDDPGKDDKTYLPRAVKQDPDHIAACNEIEVKRWRDDCLHLDWSDAALDYKLRVVARTIQQVNDGLGPDIVALQEVENIAILERLNAEYLAASGYTAILIEGNDARGIDVAFLSRLALHGAPVLIPLELPDFPQRAGDTRGVLRADFQLPGGDILTGFAVHFPAPFHPTEMRVAAYDHLTSLLEDMPHFHHAFAAGDFNTTSTEDREMRMLDNYARPHWTVAHDVGCNGCRGTHYYSRDDNWSFLDMILFREARGGNTTAQIRADSVRIANGYDAQVTAAGTPDRFDWARREGVSDHWPMIVTIEIVQKQ